MVYKIRIILDAKEDVFRTILIDGSSTLENLHHSIVNSFDFDGEQMASFYRADNSWEQGEEIPLEDLSDTQDQEVMSSYVLSEILLNSGDKLIYIYDFLELWTFYVELLDSSESQPDQKLPKVILAVGDMPETAPEKVFEANNSDDFDSDEDLFEDIDNLDLDEY